MSSGSSSDEFEDAPELHNDEDDAFMELMEEEGVSNSKPVPLLPESIATDEQECVDHFVREFGKRFGDSNSAMPLFFQGPLKEAIDQSIMLPAAQVR